MQNKNKTVVKSMVILGLFQTHARLNLQELVELSGLPKTSVHRMVGSLEEMGLLTRDAEGRYALGLLFLHYGQLVKERLDLRHLALPIMRRLRDETCESVNLIIRDGDEAIYIEKVESNQPVRVYTQIGRRAPLYAGACPRVLLAFQPKSVREEYLKSADLQAIAKGTFTERDLLRQSIVEARRLGYTVSHSELENFSSAIGAPIFDHNGQVSAGLSLAGPEANYSAENLPALAEQLILAAREISSLLGWKG